jgi:glycerol-1-phosphate dehydrogenase [NAD(P)+]
VLAFHVGASGRILHDVNRVRGAPPEKGAIGRMSLSLSAEEEALLERSLRAARDTRILVVEGGARHDAARVFAASFGDQPAVIVADDNTLAAAGRDVRESFRRAGATCEEPFLFGPDVYAEYAFVETLHTALAATRAIPVAVGSGTINDLVKLVAHQLGRPYMVVATAASVDGYTSFGASITFRGSKQTFSCPAPLVVLADLDVLADAPADMNASGYADLLAKAAAGADWILADAVGLEPIDPGAWAAVQEFLPSWVYAPAGIARRDLGCLRRLIAGLMMSGFAMQATRTSRPASGADHHFSHIWDMQHHTHDGAVPSHGFKVGIGTLSSLAMYDALLRRDLGRIDVEAAVARWPSLEHFEGRIAALAGSEDIVAKATEEMRAKYLVRNALRARLVPLRDGWPELRARLVRHLAPFGDVRAKLREADCPTEPEQIGITRERLRVTYELAYYIRRRYTVLDLAMEFGLFDEAVAELFGPGGSWGPEGGRS